MTSIGELYPQLTLFAEATHANHSAPQDLETELTTNATFGQSLQTPYGYFNPATHSWKMWQDTLPLGLETSLQTWACGYDAQWDCIPAAIVGAPHRRDRLFVIATRQTVGDTPCRVGGQPEFKDMASGTRLAEFRKPDSDALSGTYWSSREPRMGQWLMGFPIGWTDLEC